MLITKTRHARELAEKQSEIDGLIKRLEAGQRIQEADVKRIRDLKDRCNDLWSAAEGTKARLKPFITFTRGKGGRFVKKGDGL